MSRTPKPVQRIDDAISAMEAARESCDAEIFDLRKENKLLMERVEYWKQCAQQHVRTIGVLSERINDLEGVGDE